MRMTAKNLPVVFFPLLAFAIPLAINLLWSPVMYSADDLQQAVEIHQSAYGGVFFHPAGGKFYEPDLFDKPDQPGALPIQPRYLLEYPTSVLFARLWRLGGWQGNVIAPTLTLRPLVGALGILFFYLTSKRLTGSAFIALLVSFGMAFTTTYWTYSTHLDQSINMMLFIGIAFYVMAGYETQPLSLRRKFVLALILALASFYNFTAVLTTVGIALGTALMPRERSWLQRIRDFVIFCALYGIIVIVTMIVAIALLASPADLVSATFWQSVLFGGKPEYGIELVRDTLRAILGLAKSQVVYPGVPGSLQDFWDAAGQTGKALLLGYYGIVLAVLASPFVVLIIRRRHLLPERAWFWGTLGLVLLLHSAFNWFWDPGYIKYWLIPLFCIWLTGALALQHLKESLPGAYRMALSLSSLFVALTFLLNFTTVFYPESRPDVNLWVETAGMLGDTPNTALFISDSHPLDFYIAYFARRNITATQLISYDLGGSAGSAAVALVQEHIQQHRAYGGDIYLYSGSDIERLAASLGLGMDQLEVAWEFPQVTIYRVLFPPDSAPASG